MLLLIKGYSCSNFGHNNSHNCHLNDMEFVREFSSQILRQGPDHLQQFHSRSFHHRLAVFSVWKQILQGGGICLLTTLSTTTKVTSTARVSVLLLCAPSCFWVPLTPFFLFDTLFLKTDCFLPTFGMICRKQDGLSH